MTDMINDKREISPYRSFNTEEWGELRKDAKVTLVESELEK